VWRRRTSKSGSVGAMKTASFVLAAIVGLGAGCGGHHGRLQADTPILAYQKPDISEITGIDEDESSSEEKTEAPAPALTPAPAAKAEAPPAAKSPTPAPAAKAAAPAPKTPAPAPAPAPKK
jgi:hypothetical protein